MARPKLTISSICIALSLCATDCRQAPLEVQHPVVPLITWWPLENAPYPIVSGLQKDRYDQFFVLSHDLLLGTRIFKSSPDGQQWTDVYRVDGASFLALSPFADVIVTGGGSSPAGEVSISSTDGVVWYQSSLPTEAGAQTAGFLPSGRILIGVDSEDSSLGGIVYSDDNGQTWMWSEVVGEVRIVSLVGAGDSTAFASTSWGFLTSTDWGHTWGAIEPSMFPLGAVLYSSPTDVLYAADSASLYSSRNNGMTWSLEAIPALSRPEVSFHDDSVFFCATNSGPGAGLYYSLNGGSTWTLYDDPGFFKSILHLSTGSEGHLFIITGDGVVYRSESSVAATEIFQRE